MTPVQEVELFLHKEQVRSDMDKRKFAMLQSITYRYATPTPKRKASASASKSKKSVRPKSPPVIDISDSGEEEAAAVSASAAAAVSASRGAGGVKPPPTLEQLQVPKTIRMEWARIERLWYDGETDAPQCTCPTCPYSAGGPLTNRHHLIERLIVIELEHFLWVCRGGIRGLSRSNIVQLLHRSRF